jgi:hypothetical protein
VKNLILIVALFALPFSAGAEYMDVIQVTLNDDCSVQQYVQIKNDFNEQWGKNNGYRAEIAVPIQSDDLVSVFWVGRAASTAAFGAAWDAWRDALPDSGSVAAKLWARIQKCSSNQSRRGYDVH